MDIQYLLTEKSLKDKVMEIKQELAGKGTLPPHAIMFCDIEIKSLLDDKIKDEDIPETSLHLLKDLITQRPKLIKELLQIDNGKQ